MIRNLQTIRKKCGMTQGQLAAASGIHRVTIAKYESGQVTPSVDNAERLATALNVTLDDLMEADNAIPNNSANG